MARRNDERDGRKERLTDRRSILKAVGGTAAVVGTSGLWGAAGAQRANADTVVDLGQQGLQGGDLIDPYLEEHFTSGTEVRIPSGTYRFEGGGLSGSLQNCALVGSPDGVEFQRPGPEATIRPTIFAESGTVRLENITVTGKRGQEQSRLRVGAADGARMECVNVNMPDGTVDESDSTGLYAGTDHAGTLWIKSCFFSNFGNVACYVSDPYKGGNGPVVVEDCAFVNTGMSALRLAPDNTAVRGCYFEATERAPAAPGGWNQRGIKIDDAGENVLVENCHFNWSDVGAMAINFDADGEGGSGVMRDLYVYNDGGTTFVDEWGVDGNWTGENIHLTGDASHNPPSSFETVTGDQAQSPNTEYAVWTPVGDDVSPTDPTDGGGSGTGSGGSDDSSETDGGSEWPVDRSTDSGTARSGRFTFVGGEGSGNITYEFTVAGGVSPDTDAGDNSAEPDGNDGVTDNGDGTYTVTGVTGNGYGDAYLLEDGAVTSFRATQPADQFALQFEGSELSLDELLAAAGSGGDGSDGSDGTDGSDGGNAGDEPTRIIVVDGTGDAEEIAKYEFSVTGDLERNEERSTVVNGGLPWDRMTDYVGTNRAVGVVGNGKDAYTYTGSLSSISVDGKAGVTILEG